MTTRIIPSEQINTAGELAAFLRTVPPGTPIDFGAAELQHTDDERKDPNVAQSLKLVSGKPRKPARRSRKAKK